MVESDWGEVLVKNVLFRAKKLLIAHTICVQSGVGADQTVAYAAHIFNAAVLAFAGV